MNTIVEIAASYVGQTETPGNSGFTDPEFKKRIKAAGWITGQAWCSYFCELVWAEYYAAISADKLAIVRAFFSGSVIRTWNNARRMIPTLCHATPEYGALMIMQTFKRGKPQSTGHMGIVESWGTSILTLDGNTNDTGGREGYIVARKSRPLSLKLKPDGLSIIGFIHPL